MAAGKDRWGRGGGREGGKADPRSAGSVSLSLYSQQSDTYSYVFSPDSDTVSGKSYSMSRKAIHVDEMVFHHDGVNPEKIKT